jgi:hypothetical protein
MNLHWANLIGQASLVLAILALIFAWFQTREARQQTNRLKSHSEALVLITESLSTRYLGPFPEYLTVVNDLIKSARTELHIVNGNPTPAYFSAPSTWLDYIQAIERKVRSGVSVHLICMGDALRRQRLEQQFPSSKDEWDRWIPDNLSKLKEFLRFRYSNKKPEELDYAAFLDLLQVTQRDILKEKFQGVEISEVDQIVSVQVWIADKAQAVFAIQTSPTNALSHGLYTSDPRFVNALHAMIELYDLKLP